jgi:hypothetical protein
MKRYWQRESLVLVLVALGFVPQAQADPVTVTSGRFNVHSSEIPFFDFSGDGFRVTGELDIDRAFRREIQPLADCLICTAGASIRLGSHVEGELAHGFLDPAAVFNGVSFSNAFYSGDLRFDSSTVTVVDTGAPFLSLVQPFTFTGVLNAFGSPERTGSPLFVADLRGTGLVTFSLLRGSDAFNFGDLTYRFQAAATPEPGTMTLIGSGLASLTLRSRRRRKHIPR